MAIVSTIDSFTVIDQAGTPRTTGWFDVEFRESYIADGIGVDLSPHFRVIRAITGWAVSGVYRVKPEPNLATLTTPVSTRIKLLEVASGNVSIQSGYGFVHIGSGQSQPLSGLSAVWSGYIVIASGSMPAAQFGELRAIAISGTRVQIQVLGF